MAGLNDGSADLDGDGDITLDELYSYVHDRVVEEMPQQRPKKQDNVAGRIVIARNTNWTLPAHLRNALSSPIAADRLGAVDGLARLHQIGNDFVRRIVAGEIQRLADDDSRVVSAAAARLQAILPQVPESPPGSASDPAPPSATAAATQSATVVQTPPLATVPESAPSRVQGRGARIWEGAKGLRTDAWRRVEGPVRSLALVGLTGMLPILAAALLVEGTIRRGNSDGWFSSTDPDFSYVITMVAVVLSAGVCVLLPRTRSLIGPGVVLGATAASVWGLVYFSSLNPDRGTADQRYFAGHVTLVIGACLAGLALKYSQAVRFGFRRPTNLLTWTMAILAGIAAAACVFPLSRWAYQAARLSAHERELSKYDWVDAADYAHYADYLASLAWAYLAATVAAVSVLVLAAVLAPRRFRLSLLAGWLGGASAIARHAYGSVGSSNGSYVDITIFGCALLVLAAVGLIVSVRSPR
ncbi:hypothetical protein ABIE67_009146 [Streptomyces sp. V4I8]|uniref:hypothetical protein n=1 Tax=Streptomyces sp. V4I8 TaxID=3156469 RepID=UPI00351558DC